MTSSFKPAPAGPPTRSKHEDALTWVRAHPGQWIILENHLRSGMTAVTQYFARHGCHVTTRSRPDDPKRVDIYVRSLEQKETS